MEELKELIKVSISGRITGVETFNQYTEDKKSLTYKLYSNIINNNIDSDEAARTILYGKKYSGKSYDVLKKRFKEKLYTNLLFLQPRLRDTKSYAYNAYFVNKHFIVAKLLLMVAARKAGIRIMEKVYKKAQAYEITEIAMLAALQLKKDAAFNGKFKLHQEYSVKFHHLLDVLKAENQAEEKIESLLMNFVDTHNPRPDLIPLAKDANRYILNLKNTYKTFSLAQSEFVSNTVYLDLCNDYDATLKACNDYEEYLLSQPIFYTKVRHGNLCIRKLSCYLHLGKFSEGLNLAEKAIDLFESADGNKLKLQEIYFLLALRVGRYELASSIIQMIYDPLVYSNLDDRHKEIWNIYSGYLWLCLTYTNQLGLRNQIFPDTKEFRFNKLLNEVSIYSKDKQGLNFSLGILELALLIQKKQFDQAFEKIERLTTYLHKNIDKKTGARDYAFLKLILILKKYNFDEILTRKNSVNTLNKLNVLTARENTYDRTHIEVLPYQTLWEMLLNGLSK